jgi:hypothetical protein
VKATVLRDVEVTADLPDEDAVIGPDEAVTLAEPRQRFPNPRRHADIRRVQKWMGHADVQTAAVRRDSSGTG